MVCVEFIVVQIFQIKKSHVRKSKKKSAKIAFFFQNSEFSNYFLSNAVSITQIGQKLGIRRPLGDGPYSRKCQNGMHRKPAYGRGGLKIRAQLRRITNGLPTASQVGN